MMDYEDAVFESMVEKRISENIATTMQSKIAEDATTSCLDSDYKVKKEIATSSSKDTLNSESTSFKTITNEMIVSCYTASGMLSESGESNDIELASPNTLDSESKLDCSDAHSTIDYQFEDKKESEVRVIDKVEVVNTNEKGNIEDNKPSQQQITPSKTTIKSTHVPNPALQNQKPLPHENKLRGISGSTKSSLYSFQARPQLPAISSNHPTLRRKPVDYKSPPPPPPQMSSHMSPELQLQRVRYATDNLLNGASTQKDTNANKSASRGGKSIKGNPLSSSQFSIGAREQLLRVRQMTVDLAFGKMSEKHGSRNGGSSTEFGRRSGFFS
jgi:hypothetical protein